VGRFVPAAGDATALVSLPLPLVPIVVSRRTLVALAAIAVITAIHVRGLGPGRLVQNTLAGAKVAALALLIVLGFAIGSGDGAHVLAAGHPSAPGMLMALNPIMFTYSGWNAATYVAEEVRNPGRNVPLALGLGTFVVIAIYLALNALYLYAMPLAELGAAPGGRLIDTVAERLFGFVTADFVAAFTIISIAASVSAMVIAGPRVYFAMARDGVFPEPARRISARTHVPVVAIVAQSLWSALLVVCGTLGQLVSYTGFALVLFSGIAVAALFVLRRREPMAPRPFRAWGYPWAPAVFIAACAVMVANELWRNPRTSAAGIIIIAGGWPVYWWMQRIARREPSHDDSPTVG
jgi:basic amino acid/polyamine antiporter, APA family